jgi:mannan endo-1,4-beta-mannosidase
MKAPNFPPRSFSRRDFIKTTGLALPLIAAGCGTTSVRNSPAGNFVSVRNRQFECRGRPYCFLGANFPSAVELAASDKPEDRAQLLRELDLLRSIGITNLRVLAGSEGSATGGNNRQVLHPGPEEWNEAMLRGMDFLLAEMARRDLTGVFYLTNYWDWSGGMAVYVHWATGEPIPPDPNQPGVPDAGVTHMNFAARFYGLPAAQALYRQHITKVLNRKNTVNGRRYCDDPTVMAWQLCNEPRPGRGGSEAEANLPAFYNWTDATARFIKTQAPRQLVCTGSEGTAGCLNREDVFLKAHQSPAIDYVTLHLWIKNWGWLTEPQLGSQYEAAAAKGLKYIQDHNALAMQLNKPLVMEEFGISRDHDSTDPASPTTMRDDYYAKMFQVVLESCQTKAPLQGANFWMWSGEGRTPAAAADDRLAHPQSVDSNGVLGTDRTTLAVIQEHSADLARLAS